MTPNQYSLLYSLAESLPVISSHEHLLPDDVQQGMDLYRLFEKSYLTMLRTPFGRDAQEHAQFLAQCRHNSLFFWL